MIELSRAACHAHSRAVARAMQFLALRNDLLEMMPGVVIPPLPEKKVMNLVSLMNDEDQLIDIGSGTGKRMLYHRASTDNPDKTRIIFYELGKQGVSTENAVLSLEEGLQDELGSEH